jgi:hypothetical protein
VNPACSVATAFEAYLLAGNSMSTSTFSDEYGRFAKSWDAVERVDIVFTDGTSFVLTKAEYRALPRATRELVERTQSGTVSNPTASNA